MLPDAIVDELQHHGPVLIHRMDGRWWATWQVSLRVNHGALELWPTYPGDTPVGAVRKLWDAYTTYERVLTITGPRPAEVRWVGKWRQMDPPPEIKNAPTDRLARAAREAANESS